MVRLLARPFCFVGVIHLLPLPGGPRPTPGFAEVRRRALEDAEALVAGGVDGVIVENYGDAPFLAGAVEPHVVAFVADVAGQVRRSWPEVGLGLNLLRNDARGALGAAAAVGADFVRVNVHTGVMVTDQGVLEGRAGETLRYRQGLGVSVGIAADVLVKHAAPLGAGEVDQLAADTFRRGAADVLIVTGAGTGRAADPLRVEAVRRAVPEAPVWVGSGVDLDSAAGWRARANGAIVGTVLHRDGRIALPVELDRVRELALRLRG